MRTTSRVFLIEIHRVVFAGDVFSEVKNIFRDKQTREFLQMEIVYFQKTHKYISIDFPL